MEIPDPCQVYNGAQRDKAGDKSDNEVHQVYSSTRRREAGAVAPDSEGTTSILQMMPDTEDEAPMPDPSIADRHAMANVVAMDVKGEVSRQSVELNAVLRCGQG